MSARLAAAELLVAVLDNNRSLDDALVQTQSYSRLEGRDRAFARALATATLRRLGGLDAVVAGFLQRPLPETARLARALLRIGAAQALVLNTPAHAAVGETVQAANAARDARGFAKLINAVLRKVAAEGPEILAAQAPGTDLPNWLYTRWRAAYGAEAEAIAASLSREAPLDLTVKTGADHWARALNGALTPTGSVRLPPGRDVAVEKLPGFDEGAWWVQDAAAALPARLMGDVAGMRVLDLCAAPGGKTLQLAAAGAQVTAVDKSRARLARLKDNLARTQLRAEVVCADAIAFDAGGARFDAVLLDAPCTSTGTLRRHPDVAWLRRPSDVRTLSELQGALVSAATRLLKPGGMLIYAVCSLEPEEGPGVVAAALQRGWRRMPLNEQEFAGAAGLITDDGDLRTLPSHWPAMGGMDGFFAARLTLAEAG